MIDWVNKQVTNYPVRMVAQVLDYLYAISNENLTLTTGKTSEKPKYFIFIYILYY